MGTFLWLPSAAVLFVALAAVVLQAHNLGLHTDSSSCQSYTYASVCEANMCGSKSHCYWNYTTQSCGCCSQKCTYPLKLNAILCECFCSESDTCSGNRRINYNTCGCQCIYQDCTDGKRFDRSSCQCTCPENSYWDNSVMHCIADCSKMSSDSCKQVKSEKNTHAFCIRDGSWCKKPSCTTFYRDQMLCSISICEETGNPCSWVYYPYYPYTYYCRC